MINNGRLTFVYTAGKTLYACKQNIAGTPADPSLPFDATTNAWYLLTELAGSGTVSAYHESVPSGDYNIVEYDSGTLVYTTLIPYTDIHHSTLDMDRHIDGTEPLLRHTHEVIDIEAGDTLRLGADLQEAIDNFIGGTWDVASDDSLKDHLDTATSAHPASAILHTVGVLTTVDDILDDHEARITALESGLAAIPTNINDLSGEIGVDVYWDEQNVDGIEYYFKFLWKHSYESVPTLANLDHQSRIGSPFFNVNYGTRRFDIAINTDNDLVLYYAVGAKGGADGSILWSTLQQTGVIIPHYRQEQIITLDGISLASYTGNDSGSEHIDSPELFPTCSGETGSAPDDNYLIWSPLDNVTIKEIKLRSGTAMSADATVKYLASAGNGNFNVSSATQRGQATGLSLNVDDGDDLQIWSLNPQGIGHYTIQIKFEIRS